MRNHFESYISFIKISIYVGKKHLHIEHKCEVRNIMNQTEFLMSQKEGERLPEINFGLDWPPIKADNCWNVYMELSNGKVFGVDFIVSATGVQPNGNLIKVS